MKRAATTRAALALLALFAAACGQSTLGVSQRFDDSRVELRLWLDSGSSGPVVVAEFRPTSDGLHLYGIELPMTGIDGAGRPTRVDLADAGWRATGPLTASETSRLVAYAGISEPLPVFPYGPVTLRLPVERVSPPDGVSSIEVEVTFLACSSSGLCYKPIERQRIAIPTS